VLIAVACVAGAAWYVPRVMSNDRHLLTGTVVSSGIITLNFPDSGEIATVNIRLDQPVRKGQVLASEYMPNAGSLQAADKAAIAAQQEKIAQLKAAETADPATAAADKAQIAADKAQLAEDQAQAVNDQAKIAATEIIAPSDGTVVAVNGQPGETVTSSGIRDYATDSGRATASQQPRFSLLPEGPQPVRHAAASGSALPVVALRVSATWQVIALIPENSVSAVKTGQHVTIDVPAAHISGVRGQIEEVLPTPASTSGGAVYQAVVTITGLAADPPLNGMASDVHLDS
jgi:multidrug resistance efflux pump